MAVKTLCFYSHLWFYGMVKLPEPQRANKTKTLKSKKIQEETKGREISKNRYFPFYYVLFATSKLCHSAYPRTPSGKPTAKFETFKQFSLSLASSPINHTLS